MPREFTTGFIEDLNRLDGIKPAVLLLIDHPTLVTPIRIASDTQDITSGGDVYFAYPFQLTLPDDQENNPPRATLTVDNVGRQLMDWLEVSNGAEGALCTIRLIDRDDPDVYEYETTLSMINIIATRTTVSADLSFEDLVNMPAVNITYTPTTAPGLF